MDKECPRTTSKNRMGATMNYICYKLSHFGSELTDKISIEANSTKDAALKFCEKLTIRPYGHIVAGFQSFYVAVCDEQYVIIDVIDVNRNVTVNVDCRLEDNSNQMLIWDDRRNSVPRAYNAKRPIDDAALSYIENSREKKDEQLLNVKTPDGKISKFSVKYKTVCVLEEVK